MSRRLALYLCLLVLACSSKSKESAERSPTQSVPLAPAPHADTSTTVTAEPPVSPDANAATPTSPPKSSDWPGLGLGKRSTPVTGQVELLATLRDAWLPLLHDVKVAGEYAYVLDAAGMIYRAPIGGGEFAIVHDSQGGSGAHAGFLARARGAIYYPVSRDSMVNELYKIEGAESVRITSTPRELLVLAGNSDHLFATVYQQNDIYKLGADGFELFAKTPRPSELLVDGDYLYWASYNRGTVHRVLLTGGKQSQLVKARKITGFAVSDSTVFYSAESEGAIYARPLAWGKASKVAEGFDNTDRFVFDGEGIYFASWGSTGAALRLDATTHKVEALAGGLQAIRSLDLVDNWLYFVEGADLMRVRTDARMPWPTDIES